MKFLRQYPITFRWNGKERFLVADFYCNEAKLIVELDGSVHNKRKDHDKARDIISNSLGFKVLRFNNDVITGDLNGVLESIKRQL